MTRAQRRLATIATLLFAMITGACGSGSATTSNAPTTGAGETSTSTAGTSAAGIPSSPASGEGGACTLLSAGDVTAAMQQEMNLSGGTATATCAYAATADPSVLLYVQTFAGPADM